MIAHDPRLGLVIRTGVIVAEVVAEDVTITVSEVADLFVVIEVPDLVIAEVFQEATPTEDWRTGSEKKHNLMASSE